MEAADCDIGMTVADIASAMADIGLPGMPQRAKIAKEAENIPRRPTGWPRILRPTAQADYGGPVMMIVDLIDGDDFRAHIQALGVRVPDDACPQTCARMARCKHREVGVPGLEEAVRELMQQRDVMLPSVRQAIERFLLAELPRS